MRIINYLKATYRYWRLKPLITKADSDTTTGINPELILRLLNTVYVEGLQKYRIKDGYQITLSTYYPNVDTFLNDLIAVVNAVQTNNLQFVNKVLIKKSVKNVILTDFLVDSNQYFISITTVEETLRTSLSTIRENLVAADPETSSYYLRKLTNILRESYVVAEALHQAGEIKWRQVTIRELVSF